MATAKGKSDRKGAGAAWRSASAPCRRRPTRRKTRSPRASLWTPLNPADKPADAIADFGKDSDMGRPAQPEELSPAYVFLASPVTASYINGVVLPVTGGPRG